MLKTYKYRIYPTKSQITKLNQTLEICRKTYNDTLALRRNSWENEHRSLTYFETTQEIPRLKKEFPELKQVNSQVLQNVHVRVDLAFKAFFRRCKAGENPGYPRFKPFGRYDSFTYPQHGYKFNKDSTHLSKIGEVKTIFHRPIEGTPKTVTIRKTPTQKWYIFIACDSIPTEILPKSNECVGIDVGLKTFAILSTGESIDNPKFYQMEQKNLTKSQRKFSKHKDRKTRNVVVRIHERITNKREDFSQKLSNDLVNKYGTICFEKLKINKMVQNPHYSYGIMDAAWNKLVRYTTYKAEDAGRIVVLVNPENTSQMCSRCGKIVAKDISVRIHDCPYCGYRADRDLNAAINILRLGLQSLAKA